MIPTTKNAEFMQKLLYKHLYSLYLRNMVCFKTMIFHKSAFMFLCIHVVQIFFVLFWQSSVRSYRRFYAGLCSNLLPSCFVVLVADLRNFEKSVSTIALLNPSESSLFHPRSRFLMRYCWKALLTETSKPNLKWGHHHFFDCNLIMYAAIFWSMWSTPHNDFSISTRLFCSLQNYFTEWIGSFPVM